MKKFKWRYNRRLNRDECVYVVSGMVVGYISETADGTMEGFSRGFGSVGVGHLEGLRQKVEREALKAWEVECYGVKESDTAITATVSSSAGIKRRKQATRRGRHRGAVPAAGQEWQDGD